MSIRLNPSSSPKTKVIFRQHKGILEHANKVKRQLELVKASITSLVSAPANASSQVYPNKTILDEINYNDGGDDEFTGCEYFMDGNKPMSMASMIVFTYNYAYIYIDFLIDSDRINNQDIPVGLIVLGTKSISNEIKEGDMPKYTIKPLAQYRIDTESECISSMDRNPEKTWTYKQIDDFLFHSLSEVWRSALHLNNKNFLP